MDYSRPALKESETIVSDDGCSADGDYENVDDDDGDFNDGRLRC